MYLMSELSYSIVACLLWDNEEYVKFDVISLYRNKHALGIYKSGTYN